LAVNRGRRGVEKLGPKLGDAEKALRRELRKSGLSSQAIDAAWPKWWSDDAASSRSASTELRFTLARRLGLSPIGLSGDRVEFVWRDTARFKHLSGEDEEQKAALTSFGVSIGRLLIQGTNPGAEIIGMSASDLRAAVRKQRAFVDLQGLLATCWAIGVPVIHLRVFPLEAKSMHAMVVRVHGRHAILLGKDSQFPAPVAFALAHEIGHIALSHLSESSALVDITDPALAKDADEEELGADRFALTLLTGDPDPSVLTNLDTYGPKQLAQAAIEAGPPRGIEPGTLALCLGFRTKNWATANASLGHIYTDKKPVWVEVNAVAANQLNWDYLGAETSEYLRSIMAVADE
jgi:hypothetical protein